MKNKANIIAVIAALLVTPILVSCQDANGEDKGGKKVSKEEAAKTVSVTIPESVILVTLTDKVGVYHVNPASLELAIWNKMNTKRTGFDPCLFEYSVKAKTLSGESLYLSETGDYVIFSAKGELISSNNSETALAVISSYKEAMFPKPAEVAIVTTTPAAPPAPGHTHTVNPTVPASPAPTEPVTPPATAPAVPDKPAAPATPPKGTAMLDQLKTQWSSLVGG